METFLKGETDLSDISGVDLAAVLVNFNPRPLQRFLKKDNESIPALFVGSEMEISEGITKMTALRTETLSRLLHKTVSLKQIIKQSSR